MNARNARTISLLAIPSLSIVSSIAVFTLGLGGLFCVWAGYGIGCVQVYFQIKEHL